MALARLFGKGFVVRLMPLLVIACVMGPLPGFGLPWARAAEPASKMAIQIHNGLLSVDVHKEPLIKVLADIAQKTRSRLVVYGKVDTEVTQTFTDVPIDKGIRRLVGAHSVAIFHRIGHGPTDGHLLQGISEVWVFGSSFGGARVVTEAIPDPAEKVSSDTSPEDWQSKPGDAAAGSAEPSPANREDARFKTPPDFQDAEVNHWANVLFTSNDPVYKEQAVTELFRLDSDDSVVAIGTVLGDGSVALRRHVVQSLGRMENERALPLLGQALIGDDDPSVRLAAAQVFSKLPSEMSRAFLKAAANDPDDRVKTFAIRALATYNSERANIQE